MSEHLISHVVSNGGEEYRREPHIGAIPPHAGANEVPEPSIAPALLENCYSDHPFPNVTHPSHNSRLGTCWPAGNLGRSRRCATRADILRWANTHIAGQPKQRRYSWHALERSVRSILAHRRKRSCLPPLGELRKAGRRLPAAIQKCPDGKRRGRECAERGLHAIIRKNSKRPRETLPSVPCRDLK